MSDNIISGSSNNNMFAGYLNKYKDLLEGSTDEEKIASFFSSKHIEKSGGGTKCDGTISEGEFNEWYSANEEALRAFYKESNGYNYTYNSESTRQKMFSSMMDFVKGLSSKVTTKVNGENLSVNSNASTSLNFEKDSGISAAENSANLATHYANNQNVNSSLYHLEIALNSSGSNGLSDEKKFELYSNVISEFNSSTTDDALGNLSKANQKKYNRIKTNMQEVLGRLQKSDPNKYGGYYIN